MQGQNLALTALGVPCGGAGAIMQGHHCHAEGCSRTHDGRRQLHDTNGPNRFFLSSRLALALAGIWRLLLQIKAVKKMI